MASIGNKTYDLATPTTTTRTFSHNSNGVDLYITTMMDASASYVSVTYNGVSMTKVTESLTTGGTNERIALWRLASPASGVNNVVITFSAAPYNPVSSFVISGVSTNGVGNYVFDDEAVSPNDKTISVSSGSFIVGIGVGGANTGKVLELPLGDSRTLEYTHNVYNYTYGAISALVVSGGSKTVRVENSATVAGFYYEILDGAAAASTQGLLMTFCN